MGKDSLYFPHDYHARHDLKLARVGMEMGLEGIGLYWCLIEMMYEEGGPLPLNCLPVYAKTLNVPNEKINLLLTNYQLFKKNRTHFWSVSCLERLKEINAKREIARNSAKKRWNAKAMQTQCVGNAEAMLESKVKESKEKKEKKRRVKISDAEFLQGLKDNPAYKHIDIEVELGKMDAWLSVHPSKVKTRRFVVGWLNRIEAPLSQQPVARSVHLTKQQKSNLDQLNEVNKEFANDPKDIQPGDGGFNGGVSGNQLQLPAIPDDAKGHG